MKIQHNGGWMVSTFAIVIVLIMSVTILAISTRVILSLNRGIDSYSERQAYWNAHSAVSVWASALTFEATTTYDSDNGWDTGEIIIDSTEMKGIGRTGSDSNIVWSVDLPNKIAQDGGEGLVPGTVYTFTNCGQEGRNGPSQEQVNATYNVDDNPLSGAVTITTQGIQEWTAPATGQYIIETWGAAGGTQLYQDDYPGGNGAKIIGSFTLTQDDVLKIIVGQKGENTRINYEDNAAPGGGGGSFVWMSGSNTLLIAAGGGGGGGRIGSDDVNATVAIDGHAASAQNNGGIDGNGGRPNNGGDSYWAGGGAGWLSDGTGGNNSTNYNYSPGSNGAYGGRKPLNGGEGGVRWQDNYDEGGDGGFGGGGGGGSDNMGCGGGGGYSGGGGGNSNNYPYKNNRGGGAGSYCGDQSDGECVANVNATGDGDAWEFNEGHGKVIITTGTIGEGSGSSWVLYSDVSFTPSLLRIANLKSQVVDDGDVSSGITQCLDTPGCVGFSKHGLNINSSGHISLRIPLDPDAPVDLLKLKNGEVPFRNTPGWLEVLNGMTCDDGIDLTEEQNGGPQPNNLGTTCTDWGE